MAAQPSDQAPPPGQPRPSSVADASNNSVLDRLGELDRAVSLAAYRSVGCKLPRPLLMLYEHAGNGLFWLPAALIAWLLPGMTPVQRMWAANLFLGFLLDVLVVGTIKGIVGRGRPVYNKADDFVLVVSVDHYSFPSGHASRASLVAMFATVCLNGTNPPLAIAVLCWGALTGVSRALLGRHYVGDVIFGVLVGACITAALTQGSWDASGFLIPQEVSQRWFHAAAQQLSQLHWPLPLDQVYKHL